MLFRSTIGILYTGQKIVDNGFTINGRSFTVLKGYETIPTTVVKTGDIVTINLLAYENSGAGDLREISVSIGKYADDDRINRYATVSYLQEFAATLKLPVSESDKTEKTTVADPKSILKDVKVKATKIDSYRTAVEISFKITKPLESSDIFVDMRDASRNSNTEVFKNGIMVTGKEIPSEETKKVYNPTPSPMQQMKNNISTKNIVCREGFQKVTHVNGKVLCVSEHAAQILRSNGIVN